MNDAKIVAMTQPMPGLVGPGTHGGPSEIDTPEQFLAYCARVSNPGNQFNTMTGTKLIRHLIANKHWSPLQMVHIVMQIDTTRDIGRQILRHNSFDFQEFSQRYADPTSDLGFTVREARLQDTKNRQNSIETDDDDLQKTWAMKQQQLIHETKLAYAWAVEQGIAKEQARVVLPEGLTVSRMYMAGTLRSWYHYCQLRMHEATQKEHRLVAKQAWSAIHEHFPNVDMRPLEFNSVDDLVELIWEFIELSAPDQLAAMGVVQTAKWNQLFDFLMENYGEYKSKS